MCSRRANILGFWKTSCDNEETQPINVTEYVSQEVVRRLIFKSCHLRRHCKMIQKAQSLMRGQEWEPSWISEHDVSITMSSTCVAHPPSITFSSQRSDGATKEWWWNKTKQKELELQRSKYQQLKSWCVSCNKEATQIISTPGQSEWSVDTMTW